MNTAGLYAPARARQSARSRTGDLGMRDLTDLIDRTNAGYSARYSQAMLDRLMSVGDPLADRAVAALHEANYDRATDKLSAVPTGATPRRAISSTPFRRRRTGSTAQRSQSGRT